MTLIQITNHTTTGPVTVTGEQVSPNFALTPSLTHLDDGTTGLTDSLGLTHIHSGRRISSAQWIDLRDLATKLEALPINWATLTTFSDEQRELAIATIKAAQAEHTGEHEWPKWAGDPTYPALSLLGTVLTDAAKTANWARHHQSKDLVAAVNVTDAELALAIDRELSWRWAAATTNSYATAYLLAVLERTAPESADIAARNLAAAWEYGDSLAEWIGQWRTEIGEGQPLTLHGFADIALLTAGTNPEQPR